MKDRDCEPRLRLIVGTGGSESDPTVCRHDRVRVWKRSSFAFTGKEGAGSVRRDRFPGGDAA